MQTLNKAIEDAADFMEFKRKLEERRPGMESAPIAKLPGENRQQYRARLRRERKAVTK